MTRPAAAFLAVLLFAALLMGGRAAEAACVGCTCTVSAVTLDFGIYVPNAVSPTDSTGKVSVRCSLLGTGLLPALVSYDVGLSAGSWGAVSERKMRSSNHRLSYNLYADAARSRIWGDTGSSDQVTVSYGTALFGTWVDTPVYARLFARQNVKAGSYTDTIVVTVSY